MPAENPTVAIPNYFPSKSEQVRFDGGISAVAAPHTLQPNQVAASTNVDHTLEWGGGACRRGSKTFGTISGISNITITAIGRLYGQADSSPWLAVGSNLFGSSVALMGTSVGGTVTLTELGTLTASNTQAFIISSNTQAYIAFGVDGIRTDGTNNYSWILPAPGFSPAVSSNTAFQSNTGFNGSMTATVSGTVVAVGGSPYILTTASTGTGTSAILWAPATSTNWEFPVSYVHTADFTGLGGTSTYTVGVYGIDYALIGTDHPELIVSLSIDLSINDTSFTNYWHKEVTPGQILSATPDPYALLLDAQLNSEVANLPQTVIGVQRVLAPRPRGGGWDPAKYKPSFLPSPSTTFAIPIPRSDWQMVGTLPGPGFTNIQAVRYTFICSSPVDSLLAGPILTYGNQICCLSDMSAGIIYFYTFAQVVGGNIIAESAPSPPSYQSISGHFSRHGFVGSTNGPLLLQNAAAQIILHPPSALTTNTSISHAILYRQGGLLQDAYMVGSASIATSTLTMTDVGAPDLLVLENPVLSRNVFTPPGGTFGNFLGTNFTAVSDPWQERVFVAQGNQMSWSAPGNPTKFQSDSTVTVSNQGDAVQGFSTWDRLVIVNANSVYEMYGTIFEGANQNWTLNRTGCRRGSAATKTIIKTPGGILLFGYDGLSLYYPGYGVDTHLPWVNERIGDLWRGTGAADPAAQKGNRIPALNPAAIANACAVYGDNRIYLAVPTGINTLCDTVFVLDMAHQIVSGMYQYPFLITALYWDYINNRVVAGTPTSLQQLETGLADGGSSITWSFTTKDWTTPTDVILENLQAESKSAGAGIAMTAQVDTGIPLSLGTLTTSVKQWTPLSLQGTVGRRISFTASGTQSTSEQEVTQLEWDFIPQTPRRTFFETDVIPVPSENYVKTWLALIDTLGTATVTATLLVDGVPITLANGGTSTALTPFNFMVGKRWQTISMANITTGKTVQAIYSSTQQFKYYQTEFEFEPKPFDKTTWLITYKKAGGATQADMARFFAMDIEGTALATYTSTWIIDGTAFSTNTLIFGGLDVGEEVNIVRNYMDQIPFPPGGRGYLFQQQITSNLPFRVWRASLDIDRIGIKGLSRVTMNGTPNQTGRGEG